MTDSSATPPIAFDGKCGLGMSMGREAEGDANQTRVIDGHTVRFMGAGPKMISYMMTGKIKKMLAEKA